MAIINPDSLKTHLYPEVVQEIVRNDVTVINQAIAAAEAEARMYLSRFDTTALFGNGSVAPTHPDPFLEQLVKDIVCYRLVRPANPAAGYETIHTNYKEAVGILETIRDGKLTPEGWPYLGMPEVPVDGDTVSWSANSKRNHHY